MNNPSLDAFYLEAEAFEMIAGAATQLAAAMREGSVAGVIRGTTDFLDALELLPEDARQAVSAAALGRPTLSGLEL